MQTRSTWFAVLVVLGVIAAASSARADVSEAVQKKLKGKMFLAAEPFAFEGDSDAAVIKNIEKHAGAPLAHQTEGEDVATWHIALVAFMSKKPGVTQLSLDFYTDDKKPAYVANKRLSGIAADVALLATEVDISEDEGLTRGKSYAVKLTASIKGKDVVLATGRIKAQ